MSAIFHPQEGLVERVSKILCDGAVHQHGDKDFPKESRCFRCNDRVARPHTKLYPTVRVFEGSVLCSMCYDELKPEFDKTGHLNDYLGIHENHYEKLIRTIDVLNNKFLKDKQTAFSALSVLYPLVQVACTARGNTLDQIVSYLELSGPQDIFALRGLLVDYLQELDSASIANGIFVQQGMGLTEEFTMNSIGHIEEVNFGQSEGARKLINDFVSAATKNQIPEVLPEGIIDGLTVMVLANALFFDGKWRHPFNITEKSLFRMLDGIEGKRHIMRHQDPIQADYYEEEYDDAEVMGNEDLKDRVKFQSVRIPYTSTTSMVVEVHDDYGNTYQEDPNAAQSENRARLDETIAGYWKQGRISLVAEENRERRTIGGRWGLDEANLGLKEIPEAEYAEAKIKLEVKIEEVRKEGYITSITKENRWRKISGEELGLKEIDFCYKEVPAEEYAANKKKFEKKIEKLRENGKFETVLLENKHRRNDGTFLVLKESDFGLKEVPQGLVEATKKVLDDTMNEWREDWWTNKDENHYRCQKGKELGLEEQDYGLKDPMDVEIPVKSYTIPKRNLSDYAHKFAKKNVHIYLPKYTMEVGMKLSEDMQADGVTDLFTRRADLSGINGRGGIFVKEIIHKVRIDNNEEGTIAAASTIAVCGQECLQETDYKIIRADHSYRSYIVDNKTGIILFSILYNGK